MAHEGSAPAEKRESRLEDRGLRIEKERRTFFVPAEGAAHDRADAGHPLTADCPKPRRTFRQTAGGCCSPNTGLHDTLWPNWAASPARRTAGDRRRGTAAFWFRREGDSPAAVLHIQSG